MSDLSKIAFHHQALKHMGCAIAVLTPHELDGISPEEVSSLMAAVGRIEVDHQREDRLTGECVARRAYTIVFQRQESEEELGEEQQG
jgi:hypothetical protein